MKFERRSEDKMHENIKSLSWASALLTFVSIVAFLNWAIFDAHWSWILVSLESIIVLFIVRWRVAKDFKSYCAARDIKVVNETRVGLINELKKKEESAREGREQGKAFSKEDEIDLLQARCSSLELKLAEVEAVENPWRSWFEATCNAFADIIRGQEFQPRFKIKKKDFEYSMIAHHGKEEKLFKAAFDDAWKCVPEMVKNKKGRPSN